MLSPAHSPALQALALVLLALAVVGIVYQAVLFHTFHRWFVQPAAAAPGEEAVTLLKPLHGAEPRLAENLATFLALDHAGPLQLLCGTNAAQDAALPTARSLRSATAEITIHAGPRAPGANGKIGNLASMLPHARHDILVLSDSDIAVSGDYLSTVLAALARPRVGAVSCLYTGRGDAGAWSEIGAAAISYAMLPNMVLALHFGLSQPCMGSTIALRRETLDAIGGFAAFADVLADDYAIGAAVTALGLEIAVPPLLVTHAGDEPSFAALFRHHLRWQVTLRGIVGLPAHAGTLVTHALPLALLSIPLAPLPGLALTATALALRAALAARIDRQARTRCASFGQLVLSDLLMFTIFLASLGARTIDWRGSRLTMAGDGSIRPHTRPA